MMQVFSKISETEALSPIIIKNNGNTYLTLYDVMDTDSLLHDNKKHILCFSSLGELKHFCEKNGLHMENEIWAEYDFDIKTEGADENMAREVEKLLTAEQIIILKKAKDKYKKIFFKEIDIAPFVRDVSVRYEDGIVRINAKLSASINQTHPHINPENIVTMLKDRLGILSGDVMRESYDIMRTRIYFEDGKTDFR